MGLGVDLGVGCRDRMKVEPTSGGVRYKKREAIASLKYHQPTIWLTVFLAVPCAGNATMNWRSAI
jgi:hypothetical protein